MSRPELGVKRQCMSCGAKFYDLARDPATCPKCGTIFQLAAAVAPSRVAPPAAARTAPRDAEEDEETSGAETVSLEEVGEAEEAAADEDTGDDADLGEGSGGDEDTFLEEEEEGNDDVSGLIDGDIENDEES